MNQKSEKLNSSIAPLSLGIDIGTSKVSAVVVRPNGSEIWSHTVRLPSMAMNSDVATQDVSLWSKSIASLLSKAREHVPMDLIVTMGVTATSPTLVFLDGKGRLADKRAVMWCDQRQQGKPNATGTNAGLLKLGAALSRGGNLSKAKSVLEATSYVTYLLTGYRGFGKASLIQKFGWDPEFGIDSTGVSSRVTDFITPNLSRVFETGEAVGTLKQSIAEKFGMNPNVVVVSAGYDSIAALIGGGIYGPSDSLALSVGTSVVLYSVRPSSTKDVGSWSLRRNLLSNKTMVLSGGFEAGMQSIKEVRSRLGLSCKSSDRNLFLEKLVSQEEEQLDATCVALPFGGVPLRAPFSHAVIPTILISGTKIVPTLPSTLVGLRRGVGYFVRYGVDDLARHGVDIKRINMVGGGTNSPSFCQLLADCTGLPVLSYGANAASKGAAILAALHDRNELERQKFVESQRPQKSFKPNVTRDGFYYEGYQLFMNQLRAALAFCKRTTA